MKIFALVVAALSAAFLLYPSPIDSVVSHYSTPLPLTENLTRNEHLQAAMISYLPTGLSGGEDVAQGPNGCIYTGTQQGQVIKNCRPDLAQKGWQTIINTQGRPLGLHFDKQDNLIIVDAEKGLLRLSPENKLEVLVDSYQGTKLTLVDDLDIAQDGSIYFSNASQKFGLSEFTRDALSGRYTGQLFKFDPSNNQLSLLLDNLAFANGVALSADESFVLVNESWKYQITRYWLQGEKAGQSDIFLDKIPGTPDGISRAVDGSFWLAVHGPRSQLLTVIAEYPWLKNQAAKVPTWLTPHPDKYGFVIQLDQQGGIVQSLQDPAAVNIWGITSVQASDSGIYLGTLDTDRIAFYALR